MSVHCSLCEVGVVRLYVNRWVPISFILLPKAHLSTLPGIGPPTVVKVQKTVLERVFSLRQYLGEINFGYIIKFG